MTEKYKRIQDVEEKIHSVKLPYNAWKVFFLIDNEVSISQIAEYLDEDESIVEDGIKKLIDEDLIETFEEVSEDIQKEMLVEETFQPEEEITEEVVEEKTSDEEDIEKKQDIELAEEDEIITEESLEELSEVPDEEILSEEISEATEEEDIEEESQDFTEDLISVVEEGEEEKGETEESFDELMGEDLKIEDEADLDILPEDVDLEETEIDLEPMAEEQENEFDVVNLDVDFAQEVTEQEPASEVKEPEKKESAEQVGGKTILVIDDSIVIRKMVEIALEDENFNIITAVSGKEGLNLLDDKNPDLIILDLMLPDINGIDLLKTVKASKGIPVIMLSGKDSPQMVEKARGEGADAFLPKPFKDDELVEKIKELLS